MAPIHIKFCLAYYTSAKPDIELGLDHFNSSAGREVRGWMRAEGLVSEDGRPTPRLEAFIGHLVRQPLPVQVWTQPE